MFSKHNGMKPEVNEKEMWEINKYVEDEQQTPK